MLMEAVLPKRKWDLLSATVFAGLAVWVALFICSFLKTPGIEVISILAAKVEFPVHFMTLLLLISIYKTRQLPAEKRTLLWLLTLNGGIFFVDFCFYIAAYVNSSLLKNLSLLNFMLYYAPCIVYCGFMIGFVSKVLLKNVLNRQTFIKAVVALLTMNVITMALFLSSIHYAFATISWETLSQIILLSAELVLFDFSILGLMYANNTAALLFLSGTLTLVGGDFFLTYSYLSQSMHLFSYGELLWLLGLLFIYFSMVSMKKNESYDVNAWFRRNSTIKSQLTFSTFIIASGCFLLFFVLAYVFSIIDKAVFLGLPLFIIIYSVMVVILSLYIGAAFEAPFKKLKNNIALLTCNGTDAKLDESFSIDEFILLQNFFVKMFKMNDEKNRMTKRLNQIATDAAHDIRSPIAVLNTCLEYVSSIPEKERSLMRTATYRINAIANSLLNEFKEQTQKEATVANTRLVFLVALLHSIVREKKAQFSAEPVEINLDLKQVDLSYFATINADEMKRVMSNVINNAVEAFENGRGIVSVTLGGDAENITITVEDNGCGIAVHNQQRIFERGVSLKENGTGLGLHHAKSTIESWHGTIKLNSVENEGTCITLTLPRQQTPSWFVNEIKLSLSVPVAILDDEVAVHKAWQLKLADIAPELKLNFFTDPRDFLNWAEQQTDFFLLTDHNLSNRMLSGLDVIEKLQLNKRAILSSSHYDQEEVIMRCQRLGCYLLPKHLMYYVPISIDR